LKATHGLSEETMGQIIEVLAHFPQVEKAELFGSRAKRTHKFGSDVDLALTGSQLDWRTLGRIYTAFDDSKLPYQFSLVLLNGRTDPDVAAHIKRVGVPIYRRAAVAAG
jgi:predicted nucleotidyltransferase